MFARNVSFRLKSNTHSDYTWALENEILPLLRKQAGFKEEITLSNPGSQDVVAMSLWDSKAHADAYKTNYYPEVLRTFAKMIDGTPKVQTFEAITSTYHPMADLIALNSSRPNQTVSRPSVTSYDSGDEHSLDHYIGMKLLLQDTGDNEAKLRRRP
jgi:hypothetical protein